MARPSSTMIYYKKAFENARRCLKEAEKQNHPVAKNVMSLKNPKTSAAERVMLVTDAVQWCMNHHLPTWSQGTWRMVRCGYKLLLQKMIKAGRLSEEDGAKLIERMQNVSGLSRKERAKKSSSRRKKVITHDDLQMIKEQVASRSYKWGEALVIWLSAAVITGLRPNEWQTAEITNEDGKIVLTSENFKHNENRSYDTHRHIDLSGVSKESLSVVKQQIMIVRGMIAEGMETDHYEGCTALLYRCNKILWPKRKLNITLYTGRHQFSANAKADDDVSDVERAALMGHKTTRTSQERYGKKRSGSKGLTPQVANKEVLSKIADPGVKRPPSIGNQQKRTD